MLEYFIVFVRRNDELITKRIAGRLDVVIMPTRARCKRLLSPFGVRHWTVQLFRIHGFPAALTAAFTCKSTSAQNTHKVLRSRRYA
jgi:hypothetical protein